MLRFKKYGSDRGASRHGYDRVYNLIKQPRRMLEVGVLNGGGIEAWLGHFSQTKIVCVDTRSPPKIANHPRVTFVQGDSRTVELNGLFDLIIDDAAHDPISQLDTFNNLFQYCNGRYFIEDVWPMDALENEEEFDLWCWRGNIQRDDHTQSKYMRLINELSKHGFIRHDLRKGHNADSYLLEIHAAQSPC